MYLEVNILTVKHASHYTVQQGISATMKHASFYYFINFFKNVINLKMFTKTITYKLILLLPRQKYTICDATCKNQALFDKIRF